MLVGAVLLKKKKKEGGGGGAQRVKETSARISRRGSRGARLPGRGVAVSRGASLVQAARCGGGRRAWPHTLCGAHCRNRSVVQPTGTCPYLNTVCYCARPLRSRIRDTACSTLIARRSFSSLRPRVVVFFFFKQKTAYEM